MKFLICLLIIINSISSMDINLKIKQRVFNEKFFPLLNCQVPQQIIYGGAGSGKSVFIAQRRILSIIREPRNFLVVRKVAKTIRGSVYTETEKAINNFHLQSQFDLSKSTYEITYKKDGRKIIFVGLDDVEKVKSITVPIGTLTDIEIEEATELTLDDYEKLELRLRGIAPCMKRITMSFNPTFRSHWISQKFFKGQWIKRYNDEKLLILHSTHLDNKFLDQQDHDRIESKTGYLYDVYALGKWGVLGDLIFTNWDIQDISELNFDKTVYGLDFGFTVDPSASLKIGIKENERILFIQREFYEYGCTNDILASKIKPIVDGEIVWCDSAEPKSIRELRNQGPNSINAQAVKKGKDSVWHSLQWLQQWKIVIDKKCIHTIDEISQFQWKKNKDGETLKEPVEGNDHCIAALRYGTERIRLGSQCGII